MNLEDRRFLSKIRKEIESNKKPKQIFISLELKSGGYITFKLEDFELLIPNDCLTLLLVLKSKERYKLKEGNNQKVIESIKRQINDLQ